MTSQVTEPTGRAMKVRDMLSTVEAFSGFTVVVGIVAGVTGIWPLALVGVGWIAVTIFVFLWPEAFLD